MTDPGLSSPRRAACFAFEAVTDHRRRRSIAVVCVVLTARGLAACSTAKDIPADVTRLLDRDEAPATPADADAPPARDDAALDTVDQDADAPAADADAPPASEDAALDTDDQDADAPAADDAPALDGVGDTATPPDADSPPPSCAALDTTREGYVEVSDAAPLRLASGPFTIEAWGYALAQAEGCASSLISKRGPGSADGWHLYMEGLMCHKTRYIGFQVSGGVDPFIVSTRPTPLNRWFHIAVTYDPAIRTAVLWLDGTSVGIVTLPAPRATSYPLRIARDTNAETPYPWNGYLAEVRLSSVVRYTSAFPPPAALDADASTIALWNFREAAGPVLDVSGNGHTGALVGSATRTLLPPRCR